MAKADFLRRSSSQSCASTTPGRHLRSLRGATPFTPTPFDCGVEDAGMSASDLARLKQLEAENAQMQRIIARQTVKIDAMEELMRKNSWSLPGAEAVKALQTRGLSQREAGTLVHARRRSPSERVSPKAQEDARLAMRLTAIAQQHAAHGCRRLFEDYNREADPWVDEYINYKRFRRL